MTSTEHHADQAEPKFLLVKRGLYYAPDRQGYTGVKERAGRYREIDALGLDGVTAIHEDDAPMFSQACWQETKAEVYEAKLAAFAAREADLVGENARLRESRAEEWCAYMDDAVSKSPEPLRQLGEYLAGLLDEDQWKTAERYLNAAALKSREARHG